ncbi:MAG: ABC transporter permease [Acidobacteria bacterium]|nr:ABC transporter permease [Acidobacteriota bacterium]
MPWWLIRRLAFAVLLVVIVSSSALVLARLAPGDVTSEFYGSGASTSALARERALAGLDRPLLAQYGEWLLAALRFDLGTSLLYRRPVGELVRERAFNTALLAVTALAIATLAGIPLGVMAGSRSRGFLRAGIRLTSVLLLSLPSLLTSLLLVVVAARTQLLPIGGMSSPTPLDGHTWIASLSDVAWHLVVPAVALALPVMALLERTQARAMAEVLRQPFVLAAVARGAPPARILYRNALRVAVRPIVAIYGLIVGSLLSGSFIVEVVTAWPGLGRLMYDALRARDIYLVAGGAAAGSLFIAAGTLFADLMLVMLDPRAALDRSAQAPGAGRAAL